VFAVKTLCSRLPPVNAELAKALFMMCHDLSREEANMMSAGALAIVLGPNILYQDPKVPMEPSTALQHMAISNRVISKIIDCAPLIFSDDNTVRDHQHPSD